MTCTRCHRRLFRDPVLIDGRPFGPVCAEAVQGPRKRKAVRTAVRGSRAKADARQGLLFAGVA